MGEPALAVQGNLACLFGLLTGKKREGTPCSLCNTQRLLPFGDFGKPIDLVCPSVGHTSVHSDSGSRAWGSGECARCVEQQQQPKLGARRLCALC